MSSFRIRDPIHVFVDLNDTERRLIDSWPFQRLRHIHQLATTFLVFPSATHKRFEHSIGVMELATRIYRGIRLNLSLELKATWKLDEQALDYWERVVRSAALCHDLGHLPFSHGAEDLLEGINHEDLSREVIQSSAVRSILESSRPPINVEDVVKLALERKKLKELPFSPWEEILNQVITGDCFGADRMDYLLRDSYHLGVSHGHFDHHRLIECLRVLPLPPTPGGESAGYALGVTQGGLQSAEALLIARYMMFSQVYYHKTRIIFDYHLKQFFKQWLQHQENASAQSLLNLTDNDIFVALEIARKTPGAPGHASAKSLLDREHFRLLYLRNPADDKMNGTAFKIISTALSQEFGEDVFTKTKGFKNSDEMAELAKDVDFPVHQPGSSNSVSSLALSQVLQALPQTNFGYVYAPKEIRDKARSWLAKNKDQLLKTQAQEDK